VQLFSGPHPDYHRPTDTIDKIDPQGLVKIAAVAREAVVYLAGRPEPLTATLGVAREVSPAGAEASEPGRRVQLGTVPDFAYHGQGYRISEVTPDSPAAQAGLQAGDIIVQLGTSPITDLRALASILRTLQPGERIAITFRRGAAEHTVQTQLVPR
jgi:S1-C subfamily serine protease